MAPPLLTLKDAHVTFGGNPLFTGIDLTVSEGDKLCLVGRNGAGKSTLLKLLAGRIEMDQGERFLQPGTHVTYLAQEPDFSNFETALDFALAGFDEHEAYRAETLFSELGIAGDMPCKTMSGGEGRRLAIVRALMEEPHILLVDEPTNHLDVDAIEWLETNLRGFRGGMIIISHDRRFLENLTNATLWLDRGTIRRHDNGFKDFDDWSSRILEQETIERAKLDKLIEEETRWSREGISARRTRNQGRLRRLYALRSERQSQIERTGTAAIKIEEADASGKMVIEADHVSVSFDGKSVIQDFSLRVLRGDKIGIVGPNGAGKTTLLKTLIGELTPDEGKVRLGTNLAPLYLDQKRDTLKDTDTVWETLCPDGGDQVMVQGRPRHVVAYMRDFLFDAKQARMPVGALSGGERNRLMLARALTQPCNLLILDEPTNDLDIETLDLLRELLSDFDGVLLLVSHDRDFLDRLVTSTILFEGQGKLIEYAGGYSDAVLQRGTAAKERRTVSKSRTEPAAAAATPKKKTVTKLSYKDQRALDQLPDQIEDLQAKIVDLEKRLNDPDLFIKDVDAFNKLSGELEAATQELSEKEERWLELEMLQEELRS